VNTTNDELVEHEDESPSMVDKVARTSQQREATKARIVGSSDKKWKEGQGSSSIPQSYSTKRKEKKRQRNHVVDVIKRSETRLKKATKTLESNGVQLRTNK